MFLLIIAMRDTAQLDLPRERKHRPRLGPIHYLDRGIEDLEDAIGRSCRFCNSTRNPSQVLDGSVAGQDRGHEHCKVTKSDVHDSYGDHPPTCGDGKGRHQVVETFHQATALGAGCLGSNQSVAQILGCALELLLPLLLEAEALDHPDP